MRLLSLFSALLIGSATATAAPITSIDGVAGGFAITVTGAGTFDVSFQNVQVTQINGVLLGTPVAASLGTFEYSRTNLAGTFANLAAALPIFTITPAVGVATFDATPSPLNIAAIGGTPGNNTLILDSRILLASNTTPDDDSAFGNLLFGPHLTVTANIGAGDIANFIATAAIGATLTGTASFSAVATPFDTPTGSVPEPATFALASVLIAFGAGYRLVRRKS